MLGLGLVDYFIQSSLPHYKFDCSLFFKQEMELSLIGLQNAGKTSLVNVIAVSMIIFFWIYLSNFPLMELIH